MRHGGLTLRTRHQPVLLAATALVASVLFAACEGGDDDATAHGSGNQPSSNASSTSATTSAGGQGGTNAGGAAAAGGAGGGEGGGSSAGGGPSKSWQSQLSTISERHRFIDGAMFGGWGPHLGHLLRAPSSTGPGESMWFADDHCAQTAADGPVCDVLNDHSLGYFEQQGGSWVERAVIALPGTVQQNTSSLVGNDGILYSYGLDVAGGTTGVCR